MKVDCKRVGVRSDWREGENKGHSSRSIGMLMRTIDSQSTHLFGIQVLLSIPRTMLAQPKCLETALDGLLNCILESGTLRSMAAKQSGMGMVGVRHDEKGKKGIYAWDEVGSCG